MIVFGTLSVQGGRGGWPTGNGKKVCNSQACCLAPAVPGCCFHPIHPIRPVQNTCQKASKYALQCQSVCQTFCKLGKHFEVYYLHTPKKFPWVSGFEPRSCCASAAVAGQRRNNSVRFTPLRELSWSLTICLEYGTGTNGRVSGCG